MNDFLSNLLFLETRSVPVPVGLSALVVTHNRKAQLRQTLDRLLAEQVDVIVVVNNASTDGTTAMLLTITDPRLQVINLPRNMGGAGASAFCLSCALNMIAQLIPSMAAASIGRFGRCIITTATLCARTAWSRAPCCFGRSWH